MFCTKRSKMLSDQTVYASFFLRLVPEATEFCFERARTFLAKNIEGKQGSVNDISNSK